VPITSRFHPGIHWIGGGKTLEQVWMKYLREIFLLLVGIEPESPVIKAVA